MAVLEATGVNPLDAVQVLSKLMTARGAALAVEDGWESLWCDFRPKGEINWQARLCAPGELWYHGAGGLFVRFAGTLVRVSSGCRMWAFATMPAIQKAHSDAFVAICQALGGDRLMVIPDSNPIEDELCEGMPFSRCTSLLEQKWGKPHQQFRILAKDREAFFALPHSPWFLIDVQGPPESEAQLSP
jgi:hypothetical protein